MHGGMGFRDATASKDKFLCKCAGLCTIPCVVADSDANRRRLNVQICRLERKVVIVGCLERKRRLAFIMVPRSAYTTGIILFFGDV